MWSDEAGAGAGRQAGGGVEVWGRGGGWTVATMGMSSPRRTCGFISMSAAPVARLMMRGTRCSTSGAKLLEIRMVGPSIALIIINICAWALQIHPDFLRCPAGGFKWRFLLYRLTREVLTFHNICVWHATFHAARPRQYCLYGLYAGVWQQQCVNEITGHLFWGACGWGGWGVGGGEGVRELRREARIRRRQKLRQ